HEYGLRAAVSGEVPRGFWEFGLAGSDRLCLWRSHALILMLDNDGGCSDGENCDHANDDCCFCFDQAISFKTSRVKVEVDAAAPLFAEIAEMVLTKPAGAAWTELAETAPAMSVPVSVTPRLAKRTRNFSSARVTRFCAASSLTCISAATSRHGRFSK